MTDDAMVEIARLTGRGEALSVAAMLDAAGIIVHVGGEYYAGTTLEVLAVGGFRLTVPVQQYATASDLLRDLAAAPPTFSRSLQRRAMTLAALMFVFVGIPGAWFVAEQEGSLAEMAVMLVLSTFGAPMAPQARGDYFLLRRPA